jgi:methanogenic corrinoid protein MtbC1
LIRWCSYCCRFICECEPWDDYRITHGVCQSCFQLAAAGNLPDLQAMEEIKRFFRSMQDLARSGTPGEVDGILRHSRSLRVAPMDLLLGILQPLLVEIGQLWKAGRVTVAAEHQFTALAGRLMAQVRKESPGAAASGPAKLVLVNAEGNDHSLGLMMAEYYFVACGIATLRVKEGSSVQEILDLLDGHRPEAVGFSVAMAPQMRQVRKVVARIGELAHPHPHILLGGPAVRMGLDLGLASGIRPCRQPLEGLRFLAGAGGPKA